MFKSNIICWHSRLAIPWSRKRWELQAAKGWCLYYNVKYLTYDHNNNTRISINYFVEGLTHDETKNKKHLYIFFYFPNTIHFKRFPTKIKTLSYIINNFIAIMQNNLVKMMKYKTFQISILWHYVTLIVNLNKYQCNRLYIL